METQIDLLKLKDRMPYQWRVQSFSKVKASCTCVAYIDARDVMNRLDNVVGAGLWQDDYRVINNQLFAGIGILINGQWVWKWDTGTESETEKEKGIVSDSFKRAAVKWGVGRFLYDLDIQYLDANEKKADGKYPYPIDEQGKRIWDITKYVNDKVRKGVTPKTAPAETAKPVEKSSAKLAITEKQMERIIERINKGEPGVYENSLKAFTFTEDQRADLETAQANQPVTVK